MSDVGIQLYDNTGVPIARFGQFPGNVVSLRISQPGVDVTKARANQLVFNSDVKSGTFIFQPKSVAGTSSYTDSGSFLHNLGFVPSFQTYTSYPNTPDLGSYIPGLPTTYYGPLLNNALVDDTSVVSSLLGVGVDNQYLYFSRQTTNHDSVTHTSIQLNIVYYIFQYGSAT